MCYKSCRLLGIIWLLKKNHSLTSNNNNNEKNTAIIQAISTKIWNLTSLNIKQCFVQRFNNKYNFVWYFWKNSFQYKEASVAVIIKSRTKLPCSSVCWPPILVALLTTNLIFIKISTFRSDPLSENDRLWLSITFVAFLF